MTPAMPPPFLRRAIWRRYWNLWLMSLLAVSAYGALKWKGLHPLAATYELGSGARIDDRVPFWSPCTDFSVRVRLLDRVGEPSNLPLGGDVGQDLRVTLGEVGEPPFFEAERIIEQLRDGGKDRVWLRGHIEPGLRGIRRLELRVAAIDSETESTPQSVHLSVDGVDYGFLSMVLAFELGCGASILAASAIVLLFFARRPGTSRSIPRRHRAWPYSTPTGIQSPPPSSADGAAPS